jgi:hypothetical protein
LFCSALDALLSVAVAVAVAVADEAFERPSEGQPHADDDGRGQLDAHVAEQRHVVVAS